ncbi:MAG: hypothetical protein V7603_4791 [Micromonosporaceae bacterium]
MDRLTELAAQLDSLHAADFDDMNPTADGPERLQAVCDELAERDDPERWAPLLFSLLERLDSVDLGSPGPAVHTLEGRAWPGYRNLLAESVRRKPTPLTLWMVNRVLNASPPDAADWLALLAHAAEAPGVSAEAAAEARQFLGYQRRALQ